MSDRSMQSIDHCTISEWHKCFFLANTMKRECREYMPRTNQTVNTVYMYLFVKLNMQFRTILIAPIVPLRVRPFIRCDSPLWGLTLTTVAEDVSQHIIYYSESQQCMVKVENVRGSSIRGFISSDDLWRYTCLGNFQGVLCNINIAFTKI